MPNHSIKMIKLRQVFGLYSSGYGSRSIYTTLGISYTTIRKYLRIFNESCAPIWLPTNQFLKVLTLAGLPQITFKKVWHFRARRNSFPERFGISAHGESYFSNGLEFVVAKIWKLTIQRNGPVRLLGHYYSVPHTYVGKKESMRKEKYMKEKKNKRKCKITCNVKILYLFSQNK